MAGLLATLGDAYLGEMADHFAGLDLPYPAPGPPAATPALRSAGERLVRVGDPARGLPACNDCHQSQDRVLRGGFPPTTAGNPRPFGMPPFATVLSDLAELLSFLRASWGHRAPRSAASR